MFGNAIQENVGFEQMVSDLGAFVFLKNIENIPTPNQKRLMAIMENTMINNEFLPILHRQDDLILVDEAEGIVYQMSVDFQEEAIVLKGLYLREYFVGEENFPMKIVVPTVLH